MEYLAGIVAGSSANTTYIVPECMEFERATKVPRRCAETGRLSSGRRHPAMLTNKSFGATGVPGFT